MTEWTSSRREILGGVGVLTTSILGVSRAGAQNDTELTVAVSPTNVTVAAGETTTVDVVFFGATAGVEGYIFSLYIGDSAVATFIEFVEHRQRFSNSVIRNNGQEMRFETVLGDNVYDGANEIVIGNVTIEGGEAGESPITIAVNTIQDKGGNDYETTTQRGTVTVQSGEFLIDIAGTNAPVTAGKVLSVTVDIENTGNVESTQTVTLDVPELGGDGRSITLDSGESTTETFSVATGSNDVGVYTATAASENEEKDTTVTVEEQSAAVFELSIAGTNAPVTAGETVEVNVYITNTGDASGTETVSLNAGDLGSYSSTVTLESDESTETKFSVITSSGDSGVYPATVSVQNDSAQQDVAVLESADFNIDVVETNAPIEGETLEVTVDIKNTGGSSDTRTVALTVPDLGSDSTEHMLNSGESIIETITIPTETGDAGEYTATVDAEDDSAQQTVTVFEPAAFTVDITDVSSPVAGEPLEATVSIENTGDRAGNQTVELSASGFGNNTRIISLDAGESTSEELSLPTEDDDAGEYAVTAQTGDSQTTESVTVSEPNKGDDGTGSPGNGSGSSDDEATSGDDSTGSPDNGSTSDDDQSTTDTTDDGGSGGDGGLETTEMAAVGGGGGLALLFGAYALMRRSGEDDDAESDQTPTASNGSETTHDDTGASTSQQQPDSGPGDTIGDLLDNVAGTLDSAEQPYDAGEYDRALAHCERAIATAKEACATARADAPERTPDAKAALEEATTLRETIRAERDAREGATEDLDRAEEALEQAAGTLNTGDPDNAFDYLDDAEAVLADANAAFEGHDFPDLADRLAALEERREQLRQEAAAARTGVPVGVPDTPRRSLSYGNIEKQDRLGRGGNADVFYATAPTSDGQVELALKEPRMNHIVPMGTVERMLDDVQTKAQDNDAEYVVSVLDTEHTSGVDAVLAEAETYRRIDEHDTVVAVVDETRAAADRAIEAAETWAHQDEEDTVATVADTLHTRAVTPMMREAETWQKLDDHDHIVTVVDYDDDPVPWIAMEFMDGGHLGRYAGNINIDRALWTAVATTEGVRHAHDHGVAHFDLKPQNVLLRRAENGWDVPKVADWGLSKQLLDHSNSVEGMSPAYAAPEQFDTDEYGRTDNVTDIYQLGAVFYKLFTGEPPFEGPMFKIVNRIQTETPTPPSEVADLPSELDDILLTALATKKEDRYEHVLYLRDDLWALFEEYQ